MGHIAVAGTGNVGLSAATMLSQQVPVVAADVVPEKLIEACNRYYSLQSNESETSVPLIKEYRRKMVNLWKK